MADGQVEGQQRRAPRGWFCLGRPDEARQSGSLHAARIQEIPLGSIRQLLARAVTNGGGGLAVSAQGITPFSPSMAARETRLRPCGPADAH